MVLATTEGKGSDLKVVSWFDTMTVKSIGNTLKIWVLNFIPQILLALLLASWFTDTVVKLKGQGAFKIMMFMPNIITASSIAVLFYSLFNANGPITMMLQNAHIISEKYDFMEKPGGTIGLIAFMQFWMWYGNSMIVLIAGILGISPSLYEAAMVDGANSKQQFFKITLPLLKPIISTTWLHPQSVVCRCTIFHLCSTLTSHSMVSRTLHQRQLQCGLSHLDSHLRIMVKQQLHLSFCSL